MPDDRIPWDRIETLFLDAGNTLISMDFAWIARELAQRGVDAEAHALLRGEARARPVVSREIGRLARTEGLDVFAFHLGELLRHTEGVALESDHREALVAELVPILRAPGQTPKLWCSVLPRVPEALERLRSLGVRLVVVSNSDGSCEESLEVCGLRDFFHTVIDSHHVGVEKPDPRIYEVALERAGGAPATTLHVGDLPHADVAGARAAGVHALLLDPFDDWDGVDCERVTDVDAVAQRIAAARR